MEVLFQPLLLGNNNSSKEAIKMKYLRSQEAFTLIEVMVALVIGLVLIIAFSGAIVNSFKAELRI